MSSDTILKDADGRTYSYDNLSTQRFLEGKSPGAREVIEWMRERAVSLFRVGKDEQAIFLRSLAAEVSTIVPSKLDREAQDHETAFPITFSVPTSMHSSKTGR